MKSKWFQVAIMEKGSLITGTRAELREKLGELGTAMPTCQMTWNLWGLQCSNIFVQLIYIHCFFLQVSCIYLEKVFIDMSKHICTFV